MFNPENELVKMYEEEAANPQPLNEFQRYEIEKDFKADETKADFQADGVNKYKTLLGNNNIDRFYQAMNMYYVMPGLNEIANKAFMESYKTPSANGSFCAMENVYIASAQLGMFYDKELSDFFIERGEFYKNRAAETGELHYITEIQNQNFAKCFVNDYMKKNMETIVNYQIAEIEKEFNAI